MAYDKKMCPYLHLTDNVPIAVPINPERTKCRRENYNYHEGKTSIADGAWFE